MRAASAVRVAIIDNAIRPSVYAPVKHWGAYLNDIKWKAFRAPRGELPSHDDFSHIILTGSEASVLERKPWVGREVEFVQKAFAAGRSILGSCYGHQLLAFALAGPGHVRRCREPEIGWIEIEILADSPLLGPKGRAWSFSVHFDEVRDLPEPYLVLASTRACPIQAFGVRGRNVWGLQIHPEIDVSAGRALLKSYGRSRGPAQALFRDALASEPSDSRLILKIVEGFLSSFA
jgi:GMP synthase-like glutamine amidotransferase